MSANKPADGPRALTRQAKSSRVFNRHSQMVVARFSCAWYSLRVAGAMRCLQINAKHSTLGDVVRKELRARLQTSRSRTGKTERSPSV